MDAVLKRKRKNVKRKTMAKNNKALHIQTDSQAFALKDLSSAQENLSVMSQV